MYEIERFVDVNARGTAILLEAATHKSSKVERIVVASSMSLYGEGRCNCPSCGAFDPPLRSVERLQQKDFEVHCPRCGAVAEPAPTPEDARLRPDDGVRGDQARPGRSGAGGFVGVRDYSRRASAVQRLRSASVALESVYRRRGDLLVALAEREQAARCSRTVGRHGTSPTCPTSPKPSCVLSIRPGVDGQVLNVGAGRPHSLLELGGLLAREIGVDWKPEITESFRKGDIRHCTADGQRLERALGFRPRVDFRDGVRELVAWIRDQKPADRVEHALSELAERGLVTRG